MQEITTKQANSDQNYLVTIVCRKCEAECTFTHDRAIAKDAEWTDHEYCNICNAFDSYAVSECKGYSVVE